MNNYFFSDSDFPEMIILGSTGSVGEQAFDVAVRQHIPVAGLAAGRQSERLESQARALHVRACALYDETAADDLRVRLADTDIRVFGGADACVRLLEHLRTDKSQVVQHAITGRQGLEPTLCALKLGYRLALANKESLVIAGDIVMKSAAPGQLVPVDSEHSAIYQCLRAGRREEIKRIWLTASGGPFRGFSREQLEKVTPEMALAHPTWKMGPKITVDSATLMNKGFEVIEAVHLFGVTPDAVRVVIHPESIVHSMVEYRDNSLIAQLSVPDMRQCVQYAMTDPLRFPSQVAELDLTKISGLTFKDPDTETFRLLPCAGRAIRAGGGMPAALNAANEVAVAAFLKGRISFYGITETVCGVVDRMEKQAKEASDLEGILRCDEAARAYAGEAVNER